MTKSAVTLFVGLSLLVNVPAFGRDHHKHHSNARAHSGPVYDTWKAPYELPAGFGPNDIPFAPF
jgi:hypothetical protein